MRIIAGEYRSRVIAAVPGSATRPTSDKIKEAVFSRIGPYFCGGVMLDLFGGSGNMGLEAISRGMSQVLFVDMQYQAVQTMQKNCRALGVEKQCTIWKMDYRRALEKAVHEKRRFDLIYLDPPYKKQQLAAVLSFIADNDLLQEQGDVICESQKEDIFADHYGCLHKIKDTTYGITRITYYRRTL